MITLLVIIYLTFISLGLPDALLGSSWPAISGDLNLPMSFAGVIGFIVSAGTVVSSLNCQRLLKKFGTGLVVMCSVLLTAVALIGNSFAPSFIWLCLFAVPMGLGAGAVDSALNNFVALHCKAIHMNWLHCFWGVGATAGPMIMALMLSIGVSWRMGYGVIFAVQSCLVITLFLSLPLWKKFEKKAAQNKKLLEMKSEEMGEVIAASVENDAANSPSLENSATHLSTKSKAKENASGEKVLTIATMARMRGVKPALISYFCYCSAEAIVLLWGSTYLVAHRQVSIHVAALWVSFFFFGITFGRFISGLISTKISSKKMIFIGQTICLSGIVLLILPLPTMFSAVSLVIIGLGFAPIYPAMLHETPARFGKSNSSALMGVQMASAYVGTTLIPPALGAVMGYTGVEILPYVLLALVVLMVVTTAFVNKLTAKQ